MYMSGQEKWPFSPIYIQIYNNGLSYNDQSTTTHKSETCLLSRPANQTKKVPPTGHSECQEPCTKEVIFHWVIPCQLNQSPSSTSSNFLQILRNLLSTLETNTCQILATYLKYFWSYDSQKLENRAKNCEFDDF